MRLIDADATYEMARDDDRYYSFHKCRADLGDLYLLLIDAPTIDAEAVVHGEWVLVDATSYDDVYTCSECGGFAPSGFIKSNYCPKCGAKMDGKEKEE